MFKVGDRVRCINNKGVEVDIGIGCVDKVVQVLDKSIPTMIELESDGYRYYTERFELVTEDIKFKTESFSVLNYNDARKYMGKPMEFTNAENVLKGEWFEGELYDVSLDEYPFIDREGGYEEGWQFVRTIPDTFKRDNSELIEALKKSIQQWQIMYDTGKGKREVYEFLGGKGSKSLNCFLCDYTGRIGIACENKCIKWGDINIDIGYTGDLCLSFDSPYREFHFKKTKENTLAVLNHLKSELKRLENE